MSLVKKIVRPEILAQTSYYVAEAGNVVKLDAMENPYGLPDSIKAELGAHLGQVALNRYPVPSYRNLKHKICDGFGVPTGYEVILGNGSDELISMMSVACAKPGATVVAPVPTFVMYAISAQLAGMQFVGVPLRADLTLDLPALLAAIDQHQPALVFLANPNNPTGSWYAQEDLIAVINAMANIGLVVVDEAYQPFAPGSIMTRLPEFSNLVVMRTVSKLGWAGLRLGYMSASGEILAEIEKVRPPYNINVLTAAAAEFLLDHLPLFSEQANQICAQRTAVIAQLACMPGVHVFPSQANFVLIRVANAEQIFGKLLGHKILVKNVGKMHSLLADCLRVTVSTNEENRLFLDALRLAIK
ncbi:histidinol-phosphate aminotransferase [Oxalobacteraceae bacterium GrIS 2.11]